VKTNVITIGALLLWALTATVCTVHLYQVRQQNLQDYQTLLESYRSHWNELQDLKSQLDNLGGDKKTSLDFPQRPPTIRLPVQGSPNIREYFAEIHG